MLLFTKIGTIDNGINGSDTYLSVSDNADIVTEDNVFYETMLLYYRRSSGPGSCYCTSCRVILDPLYDNKAIVIVQHRYDC